MPDAGALASDYRFERAVDEQTADVGAEGLLRARRIQGLFADCTYELSCVNNARGRHEARDVDHRSWNALWWGYSKGLATFSFLKTGSAAVNRRPKTHLEVPLKLESQGAQPQGFTSTSQWLLKSRLFLHVTFCASVITW
jgi:hypothetical protein